MATYPPSATAGAAGATSTPSKKRQLSLFELPSDLFDSCRLLPSPNSPTVGLLSHHLGAAVISGPLNLAESDEGDHGIATKNDASLSRWTCNTCKAEFESLQDQRSHFKSDIHRINVKLSIAGKEIVKEDDFDELTSDAFQDYDISSISGSEDEADKGSSTHSDAYWRSVEAFKQKIFLHLQGGERVSIWKSLLLNESEDVSFDNNTTTEVIKRLKDLTHEPRDGTRLRVVLLASGGHFAGCVFDGNAVVAHKTFHRYVVRAKAGKKQSLNDASGRFAHSAGASLRRYNELNLKKDIQDLLASWKPYFDACSCVFIHAPSNNRHLLFSGDKQSFSHANCFIRNVPVNVRRPTFKEAKRIYSQLTQLNNEVYEEEEIPSIAKDDLLPSPGKDELVDKLDCDDTNDTSSSAQKIENMISSESDNNGPIGISTPLHEASRSGNTAQVLELLEQGLDPCAKDERGLTPYMLANEKEVRNIFRRFMASNLERWDWHAAKVPSALTKEMEESQAAKQAEKDAKRKARAKELKKLRKAKEKKAQAQAVASETVATSVEGTSLSVKGQSQSSSITRQISKEESLRAAQAAEREKRAAAAERRIAAALSSAQANGNGTSSSHHRTVSADGTNCSFCRDSLAGKVPFHRYNYKYCSTTCMHLHQEILEHE
ncbi:ankyrin repeat and zinc finger domain-containing protein 1 [Punica granatum]|uniref:VLRF1 domain-containing protein n=2 Tax=Punica granatum TaxID=22663 RepID=A0A218WLJ5_PUNGR|nr:ankyrin repeat and zinc finger domain-containing protein 1 [Punica granatum]OWM72902.1 hypothetical protein CDL15_Pgr016534 [Punica granatum]PKI49680.1 hypothetical protein CRG98_029925 [Punica granatum]